MRFTDHNLGELRVERILPFYPLVYVTMMLSALSLSVYISGEGCENMTAAHLFVTAGLVFILISRYLGQEKNVNTE